MLDEATHVPAAVIPLAPLEVPLPRRLLQTSLQLKLQKWYGPIFKKVWGERDLEVILNVTRKIYENVAEDSRLLTWYDPTLIRMERG